MAGGSVPPGVDAAIYREIIGRIKARGGRVLLDTSGEALRHGIEAGPDIIKPNIHELEALIRQNAADRGRRDQEPRKRFIAKGIGLVVPSRWVARARCFVTASEAVHHPAPKIKIKSTVGAGDAMVGGIVAAQLRGLPLAGCARLATEFSVALLKRNDALNSVATGRKRSPTYFPPSCA